ncbi:MAG TPA: VWA domain-containing protein [Bryobacteraceae bacterium]|nr:VWA domain-containing protein [Bryobacteraceae bacterium]
MAFKLLFALCLLACYWPARAATKLIVTVTEQKTGRAITDLKAADFTVLDDKTPRTVESAETAGGALDIMLLIDTSMVGAMVQPLAADLIGQLQPKEQMAVVSFHSSADLIQDFTSSKQLLNAAVQSVKYGNSPRVLDALYAALDGGFQSSDFRRVALVLTTGFEAPGNMEEKDVVRLARKNGVSIFPVYAVGSARSLFERLARYSGGAIFNVSDMKKAGVQKPGATIFEAMRQHYVLTISGNQDPGEKLKITVNRPDKLNVSALITE